MNKYFTPQRVMHLYHTISYLKKFSIYAVYKKITEFLIRWLRTINGSIDYIEESRGMNVLINRNIFSHSESFDKHLAPFSSTNPSILGSPPTKLSYNNTQPGFESIQYHNNLNIEEFDADGNWLSQVVRESHLNFSKSIWKLILDIKPDYLPIDWQKDIKTGFRWDAKIWHKDQSKLTKKHPGVDIKNPWEISRLQHLPLKCFSARSRPNDKFKLENEVVCELLDFIMANPIGMGVNFACPMDIGIRNANILFSLNILQSSANIPDILKTVEPIIGGYIAESTNFILNNLEYRTGLTSNHYLGNILGVLFAGAYITDHPDADSWLLFGIQEVESCMNRQFFDDGSNFEGSTSYHRLSGEMMIWAALIVLSLSNERLNQIQDVDIRRWKHRPKIKRNSKKELLSNPFVFSDSFYKKLINAIRFTDSITKQDGNVFQFGDNDSGRFIKLSETGELLHAVDAMNKYLNLKDKLKSDDQYWDENSLNHNAFLSAGVGLFNIKISTDVNHQQELQLFKSVPNNRSDFLNYIQQIDEPVLHNEQDGILDAGLKFKEKKEFNFEHLSVDFTTNNSIFYHNDFQLVVIKNKCFDLALAGISNPKQHHSLGHTHNDKLAIELQVNGEDVLFNPGTYVYTPNPEARYLFRSVKSHNTVSVNGMEQNRPLPGKFGLFNLKNETKFKLLKLSSTEIIAEVKYRKIVHQRKVEIFPKSIVIHDWCNHKFEQHWNTGSPYSNGYGKRLA